MDKNKQTFEEHTRERRKIRAEQEKRLDRSANLFAVIFWAVIVVVAAYYILSNYSKDGGGGVGIYPLLFAGLAIFAYGLVVCFFDSVVFYNQKRNVLEIFSFIFHGILDLPFKIILWIILIPRKLSNRNNKY